MPHFQELPPTLNALLTEKNHNPVKFRNNIRSFNLGVALELHIVDEITIRTGAPGVYAIKGMVCLKLGLMKLMTGRHTRHLKTYFCDLDHQYQQ